MKLLFATASQPDPETYPHKVEITFPKDKVDTDNQWTLLGKNFPSIEEWTIAAQRAALSFGISDFQCYIPERNSDNQDSVSLEFHFKSRLEYLQFCIITNVIPNENMNSILIQSPDRYHSRRREKNIHHFASQYEIPVTIHRVSPEKFKIVTSNISDLLAIETHLAKGEFDKGRLLTFQKAALLDPEFWPS